MVCRRAGGEIGSICKLFLALWGISKQTLIKQNWQLFYNGRISGSGERSVSALYAPKRDELLK